MKTTRRQRGALLAMLAGAFTVGAVGIWSATQPAEVPEEVPFTASIGGLPTDRPDQQSADIPLPAGVPAPGRGYLEGREDAPRFVQVWSGMQCDICGRFEREAATALKDATDAGDIQVEYAFGAFVGPGSEIAANALGCAADQDRFHEFLDLSDDRMPTVEESMEPGFTGFTSKDMIDWGAEIGMPDESAYQQCVMAGTYLPYVETVMRTMVDSDMNHVPSLILDGVSVFGTQMTHRQFLNEINVDPSAYIPDGQENTDLWEDCGGTSRLLAKKQEGPLPPPSPTAVPST